MWQLSHPRDEWPRYLWRVIHADTQSLAHPDGPFQRKTIANAAIHPLRQYDEFRSHYRESQSLSHEPIPYDRILAVIDMGARQDPAADDLFAFLDMMANHVNWYNISKTWFVSTFSDGDHARRWVKWYHDWAQYQQKNDDIIIYKIDTTKLPPSARLFNIETLNELFWLQDYVDDKPPEDEVLVFGRIPEQAVVDMFDSRVGKSQRSSDIFFTAGQRPSGKPDENLDDDQVRIRAQILGALDVVADSQHWVSLTCGIGASEGGFPVPVAVARHFGYKESDEEESVEEELVEKVVVEEGMVVEEVFKEKEQEVVKEVVEAEVEDEVKGKDNYKAGKCKCSRCKEREQIDEEFDKLFHDFSMDVHVWNSRLD